MIRLEDQNVRLSNPLNDQFGGVTEISQETDVDIPSPKQKPDGIIGIVRDAEGINCDVADFECRASAKDAAVELGFELLFDRFLRQSIGVDRHWRLSAEGDQPLNMIAMLVRNQDSMQGFRCTTDLSQALADLSSAKASINQKPGFVSFEVSTVASRTAAENGQSHSHGD